MRGCSLAAAAIGIVALEVSARAVLGYFDPSRHGNTSVQESAAASRQCISRLVPAGASPWLAMCDSMGNYYAARFGVDLRPKQRPVFIRRTVAEFLSVVHTNRSR